MKSKFFLDLYCILNLYIKYNLYSRVNIILCNITDKNIIKQRFNKEWLQTFYGMGKKPRFATEAIHTAYDDEKILWKISYSFSIHKKFRISSFVVANNYIGKYVTHCARLVENW